LEEKVLKNVLSENLERNQFGIRIYKRAKQLHKCNFIVENKLILKLIG